MNHLIILVSGYQHGDFPFHIKYVGIQDVRTGMGKVITINFSLEEKEEIQREMELDPESCKTFHFQETLLGTDIFDDCKEGLPATVIPMIINSIIENCSK